MTRAKPGPREAPGPRSRSPLGLIPRWRADQTGTLLALFREHGDVVAFRLGPERAMLLADPAHIQRVLVDNHRDYTKGTPGMKKLRAFLGQGLLTSEGSFWLRQRRIAQPAFHRARIAGFAEVMARFADEQGRGWRDGAVFDASAEMARLTLRIAGEILMGADVTAQADTVGRALTLALRETIRRISNPFLDLIGFVPTPGNRAYRAALAELDRVVMGLIAERRRSGADRGDVLSMLMLARDEETGEMMDDRQLRDETMTLFLAGHETTANALSWTWHLLSRNPGAETRLHQELDRVLGGRLPLFEDLARLPYTAAVISESLRLFPPAWIIPRLAAREDRVGEYRVPKGTLVFSSPFVTHRHPGLWMEPEEFRPERFLENVLEGLPRFAYFPFGGGPRQCIGNTFALMEAQLALAVLAQRWRLEPASDAPVTPEATITLRPRGGLKMRALARPLPVA